MPCHPRQYHTIPHTIPHHTTPYHTIRYHRLLYAISDNPVPWRHATPYHNTSYLTLPHDTTKSHTVPHDTIPSHPTPRQTMRVLCQTFLPSYTIRPTKKKQWYYAIPYHTFCCFPLQYVMFSYGIFRCLPNHITSCHHFVWYHIVPHHVTSCHVISNCVTSYPIISFHLINVTS